MKIDDDMLRTIEGRAADKWSLALCAAVRERDETIAKQNKDLAFALRQLVQFEQTRDHGEMVAKMAPGLGHVVEALQFLSWMFGVFENLFAMCDDASAAVPE